MVIKWFKENKLREIIFISIFVKSDLLLIYLNPSNDFIIKYSVFTTLAPIILLLSFAFLLTGKSEKIYLLTIDLMVSLLFVADIVNVRAFGHFISFYMIFTKGLTEDLGNSILSLVKWTDFLMLIDLPILIIVFIKAKTDFQSLKVSNFFKTLITVIVAIALVNLQGLLFQNSPNIGNKAAQPILMSPLGYHLIDLYSYFFKKNINLSEQDILRIDSWFAENARKDFDDYWTYFGRLKGKNIIVIQVESLENILIERSFYGKEVTPNINRLLSSSIYFNNIYEQTKDGNSSDAELLFNTSTYPLSIGSAFMRFPENKYNSLANLLKQQGYTSAAIHGDDKQYWNRDIVFPKIGFDEFIGQEEFLERDVGGMGILDKCMFDQSLAEIKKMPQPYYLFMISLTSHMPFDGLQEQTGADFEFGDDYTDNYLKTINYLDGCLGDFIKQLENDGLLQNTAIVIYGDHEGVHKYYLTDLPDNNLHIPFVIYNPGTTGVVITQTGGQVDMMPTLAFLMGIEANQYTASAMGHNLLSDKQGYVLLPGGEIIGNTNNDFHLKASQQIADLIIRGDYFGNINHK